MPQSTATFLLPDTRVFGVQRWEAALLKWLGKGDVVTFAPGRRAQWQRHFVLSHTDADEDWPLAALSRQAVCADAADFLWLRADPAWLAADINGVRLLATGERLQLSMEEAVQLAAVLQPLFADVGLQFDWPVPGQAWLRLPADTVLPRFVDPEEALGDDVFEHTDTRPEAREWRTLAGEVQMQLHAHPVNKARLQRGLPPVNALWFWGAGRLPKASLSSPFKQVCSADARLSALALAAAAQVQGLPSRFVVPMENTLFDLAHLRDLRVLQDAWLQPALQALQQGQLLALRLDVANGVGISLQRGQRWRVWRKAWHWPAWQEMEAKDVEEV